MGVAQPPKGQWVGDHRAEWPLARVFVTGRLVLRVVWLCFPPLYVVVWNSLCLPPFSPTMISILNLITDSFFLWLSLPSGSGIPPAQLSKYGDFGRVDVSAIQEPLAFILPKREPVFSLDEKEPLPEPLAPAPEPPAQEPSMEPGPSANPEGGQEKGSSGEPGEPTEPPPEGM